MAIIAGRTIYKNKAVVMPFRNITDQNGEVVDFSTASAITYRVTTLRGSGSTVFSRTLGSGVTVVTGGFDVAITAANANQTPGVYWHECVATISGEDIQVLAPSKLPIEASAI